MLISASCGDELSATVWARQDIPESSKFVIAECDHQHAKSVRSPDDLIATSPGSVRPGRPLEFRHIEIDPEIMSGAPCFAGTGVPIQHLMDYLEGGDSIEDFLDLPRRLARAGNRFPRRSERPSCAAQERSLHPSYGDVTGADGSNIDLRQRVMITYSEAQV